MSVTPINAFSAVPTSPSGHRNSVAAARAELHDAVPAGQWNAVLAEVARIQQSTAATPLQAYETVLAKLAAGWMPSR